MSTIKLMSSDGKVFVTEVEVAKCSGTIKILLQDFESMDMENVEIPLANVNSRTLERVLEWSKHHVDHSSSSDEVESKDKRTDDISLWDMEFLKVDQATLFEIILAANYLDTKGLLEVTCKTIANMIKGRSPEEVRQQFNIQNDFTPDEEEQILKENYWCEEK